MSSPVRGGRAPGPLRLLSRTPRPSLHTPASLRRLLLIRRDLKSHRPSERPPPAPNPSESHPCPHARGRRKTPRFSKETHVASAKPLPGCGCTAVCRGPSTLLQPPSPARGSRSRAPCTRGGHPVSHHAGPGGSASPRTRESTHATSQFKRCLSHSVRGLPAWPPVSPEDSVTSQSSGEPIGSPAPKTLFRPPRQRGPAARLGEGVGSRQPGLTLSRTHSSKQSLRQTHSFPFLKVFVLPLKTGLLCLWGSFIHSVAQTDTSNSF